MIVIKIRRAIVYVATGLFFAVAALAQLQGAGPLDAFLKAGVACLILTAIGFVIARIVDDAARRATEAATTSTRSSDTMAAAAAGPTEKE